MTKNQNKNYNDLTQIRERNNSRLVKSDYLCKIGLVNKFLVIGSVMMIGYFIISVNSLATKGFALQKLRLESIALEDENKQLEMQSMKQSSYENISRRAGELRLVKVDKINYVNGGNETVAKK
jgi:hypothetical protein